MAASKNPAEVNSFKDLLQNRSFFWLWIAQILSQFADKILLVFAISLLLSVYHVPATEENVPYVSAIYTSHSLPAVFFGAAAGVFADRYLKKQVMVASNLLRAMLMPLILILPPQFALLLVVIFAISTVTQFFAPAEQTILPLVVKPENLLAANSIFQVTQLGSIIGLSIGIPLIHFIGNNTGVVLFLGGSYLLSAVCCQLIQSPEIRPENSHHRNLSPIPDIKEGLKYLQSNRIVLDAIVQIVILYCIIATLQILAVKLGIDIKLQPEESGYLVSATGVGLLIGAGILGQWGNRLNSRSLPLVGFLTILLALAGYIAFKILWIALLVSVVLGFGASLVVVPMQTLIQEKTPESMRGKVFGFQNNVANIALSLPTALTGNCVKEFGLNKVIMAMILALLPLIFWIWKKDRNILHPLS